MRRGAVRQGRVGARRWMWAGAAFGAIVVSIAVFAVLNEPSSERGDPNSSASGAGDADGDGTGTGGGAEAAASGPHRSLWQHVFPQSHSGPVWITVESTDARVRTLRITWGAWKRSIVHDSTAPVTYHFTKGDDGTNVPITVEVEPAATVTFGSGAAPPSGAEDINEGWEPTGTTTVPDT